MTARYFHGGVPGLRRGDRVLPPDVSGAPTTADYGASHVCRRDRVYLGDRVEVAAIYAAMHPSHRGEVYEVAPEGDVEHDPDWHGEEGVSVQAPGAVVIRSVHIDAAVLTELRAELLRPHLPAIRARVAKPGRNDPCSCGSGKKFKRCCL